MRDILRDAVARSEPDERNLGSRIASPFAGIGVTLHVPELRGQAARAARFKP